MKPIRFEQFAPMGNQFVQYPLVYLLDTLVDLGFSRVELWGGAPHVCVEIISDGQAGQIRQEIEGRGLRVACFTPETCFYAINIAAEEESLRRRSLEYLKKSLHLTRLFGTDTMQIVPGKGLFDRPAADAWARSREGIAQLAELAEDMGVCLVMEPLIHTESNLMTGIGKAAKMLREPVNKKSSPF